MEQKTITIAIIAILLIAGVGGAVFLLNDNGKDDAKDNDNNGGGDGGNNDTEVVDTPKTFVDAVGRTVTVPDNVDRGIVTIGSGGPLRFLSIFDVYDKIVEIDAGEASAVPSGRGFSYAYDYTVKDTHTSNKIIGEEVENLASNVKPSLIIIQHTIYQSHIDLAKSMEAIPDTTILVIYSQEAKLFFTEDFHIADYYKKDIEMLGKVLKMEDRAKEHLDAVEAIFSDIRSLVKGDPGTTYVAGMTARGSNEWTTTFPVFLPLDLTGGKNACTKESTLARVDLNPEEAMQCIRGSDRIVIDPSSSDKLKTPNSQIVMKGLYEINNDADPDNDIRLFVTYPIVMAGINYDCILASAYHMIYVQYGTLTLEQLQEKITHVFEVYYGPHGTDIPERMTQFFMDKSASNGVSLPILQEVEIVKQNDVYVTAAVSA